MPNLAEEYSTCTRSSCFWDPEVKNPFLGGLGDAVWVNPSLDELDNKCSYSQYGVSDNWVWQPTCD